MVHPLVDAVSRINHRVIATVLYDAIGPRARDWYFSGERRVAERLPRGASTRGYMGDVVPESLVDLMPTLIVLFGISDDCSGCQSGFHEL